MGLCTIKQIETNEGESSFFFEDERIFSVYDNYGQEQGQIFEDIISKKSIFFTPWGESFAVDSLAAAVIKADEVLYAEVPTFYPDADECIDVANHQYQRRCDEGLWKTAQNWKGAPTW